MEPLQEPRSTVGSSLFTPQDWAQTPAAVHASVHPLHDEIQHLRGELGHLQDRVETLEARLHQHSTTSSRPSSSDAPSTKPRRRTGAKTGRKGGGKPGHPGHRQVRLAPTMVEDVLPESCACGRSEFARIRPSYTHQVIERPPIEVEVTHWVVHQGRCVGCGRWHKAPVPEEQVTGDDPRMSALMAELAGTYGHGRRMVQTFCASVLGVPISLGAIQKVVDRVTRAIEPHDTLIATQARHAPVNDIDETPWYCEHALEWLWVMAHEQGAFSMIHARRSKEAFVDLIEDWAGLLVSDGYGVYQRWVHARQTCLAPLIRTARGLATRQQPELSACGAWALVEWQRWCQMAKAPPSGGEWRAWYARLCTLIDRYHARSDDAGRFTRRVLREMDSLGVFVSHHGVEPTNNRSERALRCGVQWRKRSLGTASDKGNRWVERIVSLKETCRLRTVSTYAVLVDALSNFFRGQQPDLAWLQ
jgi:transposase